MRSSGGELVPSSAWTARYGTAGLPVVDGPNVMLVEATLDATRVVGGWRRTDGLQWLFEQHGDLAGVLDRLAVAAGVDGWPVTVEDRVVDAAPCTTRTYASVETVWRIQGCTYPRFPTMFAAGVSRDVTFDVEPVPVEPTAAPIVRALGGTVVGLSVRFGHPNAVGSVTTLRTRVEIAWPSRSEAVAVVTAGPLAGWRASPGEGSTMVAGPPGSGWVVTDTGAVFTGDGRLAP